jgi:hypothetical protein
LPISFVTAHHPERIVSFTLELETADERAPYCDDLLAGPDFQPRDLCCLKESLRDLQFTIVNSC